MIRMRQLVIMVTVSLGIGMLAVGCGSGSEEKRTDFEVLSPEIQFATDIRDDLEDLQNAEGGIANMDVEVFLENMEDFEEQEVGENLETYRSILAGARELKALKDKSATAAELKKKLDELVALADKLPSK